MNRPRNDAQRQLAKINAEIEERKAYLAAQEAQIESIVEAWSESMRNMQARINELAEEKDRLLRQKIQLERQVQAIIQS